MKAYTQDLTTDERKELATLLNRALGFSRVCDAESVVRRIRGLVDAGEWPETVLNRLNGPAQLPPSTDAEFLLEEPELSRSTRSAFRGVTA